MQQIGGIDRVESEGWHAFQRILEENTSSGAIRKDWTVGKKILGLWI